MEKNKAAQLEKLIERARRSLGLNGETQQALLRKVRKAFDLSNDELANALGCSLNTLLSYLAPEGNAKYRKMADADRLILARVLTEQRARK